MQEAPLEAADNWTLIKASHLCTALLVRWRNEMIASDVQVDLVFMAMYSRSFTESMILVQNPLTKIERKKDKSRCRFKPVYGNPHSTELVIGNQCGNGER